MRSSATFRGLPESSDFFGSMNYLYGISDFWSFMFSDKEVVDRTLEATTYQLSDIYSKFVQLTSTISLQDIRNTFHSQLKLVLIDDSMRLSDIEAPIFIRGAVETTSNLPPYQNLQFQEQKDALKGEAFYVRSESEVFVFSGYSWVLTSTLFKYQLPIDAVGCSYLMDRPFLPKTTLENRINFYMFPESHTLELYKSLSSLGFPSRKVLKTDVISFVDEISASPITYRIYLGNNGFYIEVTQESRPDLFEGSNSLSVRIGDSIQYEVSQYALWATDVEVDEGALWSYYGRFVNISPATSTQMYRDFIRGLYFLYSRGPALRLLQLGLNLCIGIPTARQTEEILHFFQDGETGNYNVITANNNYVIPYGIPPDYAIGRVIEAGSELSQVAQIQDYKTNSDWWLNISIPRKILPEYPDTLSTVAAPGTTIEYYMRTFLKFNTFLVNIKLVSGIGSTSVTSITDLIDSARASYTLPIYVWQVPVSQDLLKPLDEEFTSAPTLRLGDILLFGEMIKRSKAFLPTIDITSFPGAGMLGVGYNYRNVSPGYITDGTTYLPSGQVATATTSSTWKYPANNGERACGRWIRSNTDVTSYLGGIVDTSHGLKVLAENSYSITSGVMEVSQTAHGMVTGDYINLISVIDSVNQDLPTGWYRINYVDANTFSIEVSKRVLVNPSDLILPQLYQLEDASDSTGTIVYEYVENVTDSRLIPLYNITVLELKQKFTEAAVSVGLPLPKRFLIEVADADTDNSVYELFFAREDLSNPGGIGYNCGDLPPYVLEAKRRFLPDQGDLNPLETLAFFEVSHGVYSAFLVRATNTMFDPVYFPPREEEELEVEQALIAPSVNYRTGRVGYASGGAFYQNTGASSILVGRNNLVVAPGAYAIGTTDGEAEASAGPGWVAWPSPPDVYVANGTNNEFPGAYMVITLAWTGKDPVGNIIAAPLVLSGPGLSISVAGSPFVRLSAAKTTTKSISFVGPLYGPYVPNVTNVAITYTHSANFLYDQVNGVADYCPSFTFTGTGYTNVLSGQAPGIYT